LFTAASLDGGERPFQAFGELAFAGWLQVAPSPEASAASASGKTVAADGLARPAIPNELAGAADSAAETIPAEGNGWSAGREFRLAAAPVAGSGPNQDPGASQAAAISASEDDGGANRQASPGGSPDQAGDVSRKKTGEAAGRDEPGANHGSLQPAVEFGAADGISSGPPSVRLETGSGAPGGQARGAAADRQTPASSAGPEPEPAPRTPARDITLRLSEGDQRVDVRLVERQGAVHVEVRTPDAGLAGDLRRDLPSLAARLEQSGMRAETWRGEPEGRRFSGSHSPAAEQDANAGQERQRSREGRDDQPRRSPHGEEQIDPKEERKEFEWFMSSHR
jgi:hypothetical protein